MTDPNADRPEIIRIDCSDCHGWPAREHIRYSWVDTEKNCLTELWHLPECPSYLIERIMGEDSARRYEERSARARASFPAAHQRLLAAAASVEGNAAAAPFAAALTQLVQAQADTTGFVVLTEWVEALEQHFPPEQPNPKPE
ncbi:hypothetical protein [Streptomyces tubercidicus]|uniref:hypothetical protein n=1 Tax=Streptomyces tubercidicus TaxID=47759 RepID=UPI0036AFD2D7